MQIFVKRITDRAGRICAVDEAVKNTNAKLISVELPRDTKGWGGHGNYIVIGGRDVSDVRQAITIALELTERNAGGSLYKFCRTS